MRRQPKRAAMARRPPKREPQPGAAVSAGDPGKGPVKPEDVPPGLVCLGAFAGGRGVAGEVRIKPFTDDPLSVGAYGPVQDRAGRAYTLTDLRVHKDGLIGRVDGVRSRDAADALRGQAFFVSRDALPAPDDEDDFYQADLIGLEAVLEDGSVIGSVRSVQDFGAGDLLDVRLAGEPRSVLVPFTKAVVPVVDIAGRRLVVVPPPGLFDEPEPEPAAQNADAARPQDGET